MILDTLDQQRAAVHSEKTVYLFCDSISGIEAVNNPNSSLSSYNITRLNRMCQQFSTSGVKINLLHIPGHTGIPGNTIADMHAKDTAYKIFKGEIAAPLNVSISTAFTVAGDIVKKSWQRLLDHEQTGRYTYNLIPLVNSKVLFPHQRDIGISYCRLLSVSYTHLTLPTILRV